MNRFVTGTTTLLALLLCASASAADIDWSRVDQAIGKKGTDHVETVRDSVRQQRVEVDRPPREKTR